MRKKGCYHKNRPFRLLVAAALRFVQFYLNDIDHRCESIVEQQEERGVLGHQSAVFLPLTRHNERDVSLALQMCSPLRVDIGAVCIKASVRDRRAVQIDLLCGPQVVC